jgi:hypothetical protein
LGRDLKRTNQISMRLRESKAYSRRNTADIQ